MWVKVHVEVVDHLAAVVPQRGPKRLGDGRGRRRGRRRGHLVRAGRGLGEGADRTKRVHRADPNERIGVRQKGRHARDGRVSIGPDRFDRAQADDPDLRIVEQFS